MLPNAAYPSSPNTTTAPMAMTDPNLKPPESSMLLRLPLEIRRKIYGFSLLNSRNPSTETIYLSRLPSGWRDPPSPLLSVNGQVRDEVIELVQICPTTLRVTHQGSHYDSLAETCFVAQRRSRAFDKTAHLRIDIWPPHPDRPVDMIDIWRHLRKLRKRLRAVRLLKQISFVFRDNEMATWTLDGEPLNLLAPSWPAGSFPGMGGDDITNIMDLFTRVSAVKATFHMPHGLAPGKETEEVHGFLRANNDMMMGRIPIDEDVYKEEDGEQTKYQNYVEDRCRTGLEAKGTRIARKKLDAMTNDGRLRLTHSEWEDFISIWSPNFWLLRFYGFKNYDALKKHYIRPLY